MCRLNVLVINFELLIMHRCWIKEGDNTLPGVANQEEVQILIFCFALTCVFCAFSVVCT